MNSTILENQGNLVEIGNQRTQQNSTRKGTWHNSRKGTRQCSKPKGTQQQHSKTT